MDQNQAVELNPNQTLELIVPHKQQTAFGTKEMLIAMPFTYAEVCEALLNSRSPQTISKRTKAETADGGSDPVTPGKRLSSPAGRFSRACALYAQAFTKGTWSNGKPANRGDAVTGLLNTFNMLKGYDYAEISPKAIQNLQDLKQCLTKEEAGQLEFIFSRLEI
jgi:hypothetical protein